MDDGFEFLWHSHRDDATALRDLKIALAEGKRVFVTEQIGIRTTIPIQVEALPAEIHRRRLSLAAGDLLHALQEAIKTHPSPKQEWQAAVDKALHG